MVFRHREAVADEYIPLEEMPISMWVSSLKPKGGEDKVEFSKNNLVPHSGPVPASIFEPIPYLRPPDERPIAQTFAPQRALTEIFEGAAAETNGAGHREPQLAPLSEEAEAVAESLVEFEPLQDIEDPIENQRSHRLRFAVGKLAVRRVRGAVGFARRLRLASYAGQDGINTLHSRFNSLDFSEVSLNVRQKAAVKAVGAVALLATANNFLGEKRAAVNNSLNKLERIDKSKTALAALSTVALAGAGIVVAKYGFNLGGQANHVSKTAENITHPMAALKNPSESLSHLHDKASLVHLVGKLALNSAHESAKNHVNRAVNVLPGMGYTQVLKEYFKTSTPDQLHQLYIAGIDKFGPDFIKGSHHYQMENGDYGLVQGKAHLTHAAFNYFSGYIKSH